MTEIKQLANSCDICQQLKPWNQKGTLILIDDGEFTFDRIGLDIFELDHKSYLITVDYFSESIEVDYLPTTTSRQVITKVKAICARYGVPRSIISDNDPQFKSKEFENFTRVVH